MLHHERALRKDTPNNTSTQHTSPIKCDKRHQDLGRGRYANRMSVICRQSKSSCMVRSDRFVPFLSHAILPFLLCLFLSCFVVVVLFSSLLFFWAFVADTIFWGCTVQLQCAPNRMNTFSERVGFAIISLEARREPTPTFGRGVPGNPKGESRRGTVPFLFIDLPSKARAERQAETGKK